MQSLDIGPLARVELLRELPYSNVSMAPRECPAGDGTQGMTGMHEAALLRSRMLPCTVPHCTLLSQGPCQEVLVSHVPIVNR